MTKLVVIISLMLSTSSIFANPLPEDSSIEEKSSFQQAEERSRKLRQEKHILGIILRTFANENFEKVRDVELVSDSTDMSINTRTYHLLILHNKIEKTCELVLSQRVAYHRVIKNPEINVRLGCYDLLKESKSAEYSFYVHENIYANDLYAK